MKKFVSKPCLRIVMFLFFSGTCYISFAQAPAIEWQKALGGTNSDLAASIQQTSDGGYIIAGATSSNDGNVSGNHGGTYDCWVVKIDVSGNLQWQKALGGTGDDVAEDIKQTSDGGYILAGYTNSNDGNVANNRHVTAGLTSDYWVVKLDAAGNVTSQQTFGGTFNDYATSVEQTSDGGYIVGGYSESNDGDVTGHHGSVGGSGGGNDYWIIKLDATETLVWQKSLGGTDDDYATSLQQTTDGGYVIAGYTNSSDGDVTGLHGNSVTPTTDYWIVKTDASGNLQWQKALGGSNADQAHSVKQTTDGNYIVAGYTESNDGDVTGNHGGQGAQTDYWVVKLNTSGSLVWQKALGGTGQEEAYSIQQATDGGYIVGGTANSTDGDITGNLGGDGDYWLTKLDAGGNLQWQKSLGGSGIDEAYCVRQTSDGGYIAAGQTTSNDEDVSGNHGLAGTTDVWVVKLQSDAAGVAALQQGQFNIYPNPATDVLNITLSQPLGNPATLIIKDATGQQVLNKEIKAGEDRYEQNILQLANGIYFISMQTAGQTMKQAKFVKM